MGLMRIIYFFLLSVLLVSSPVAYAENMCQSTASSAASGTLYDSGGAGGAYGANENCSFLINPSSASSVTLTFSAFDLETNYDFLEIYDGGSTSAPRIVRATGTTGGSYTATSGVMLVVFRSDFSIQRSGFTATWSAVTGPVTLPLPRADWHLDEMAWVGAAGEIKDYSGNSFHGRASEAMITSPDGVVCRAIDLTRDNTYDYLNFNSAPLHAQNEISISVWGKTQETGSQALLSAFGPDHGNELLLWFDRSNYFQPLVKNDTFSIGSNGFSTINIADNQWHHFVYTRKNDKNCLYIDGTLQGCRYGVATGALNLSPGAMIMGQEQDALLGGFDWNQDWDGWLDEPMVFSTELTAAQVTEIYRNQGSGQNYDGTARRCELPDPIVNYRFDTCNWANGQDVIDSGPLGLDAYSVNGVLSTVGGQICGLARFDSVDDYVLLPDRTEIDLSTTLTAMAWVNLKATPTELKTILSKDTNYEFHINSNRQVYWWWTDSAGTVRNFTSGTQIPLNSWQHIAITYTSGLQIIYINGVEAARRNYIGSLTLNTRDLQIGQDNGFASRFFNGDIDEVKLFNVALDAFEITSIYQNELAGRNYDGALRSCNCTEPVSIDHYAISHAGSMVSCLTSDITFTAHDNVDAAVDAKDALITITTSTSKGSWLSVKTGSGVLTNLGNGQATYQFPDNGEKTVTLEFAYPDLTTDPETVNFNVTDGVATDKRNSSSPEDQNIVVSESGLVFDLPDTESCLASSTVTVRAVRTSSATNSCASAVSGNRTVSFYAAYLSPLAGTVSPVIRSQGVDYTLGTTIPGVPVNMQFNAQGEATMQVTYADAGRLALYASLTVGNKTLIGSDTFVSYPAKLVPRATIPVLGTSLTNQTLPGGTVLAASANFDIAVEAQCADGTVTKNYVPTNAQLGSQLRSPLIVDGATGGSFTRGGLISTLGDGPVWQALSGFVDGVSSSVANYSEVGVITLLARDNDYKGHVIAEQQIPVGRFIPWRFALDVNIPQWGGHCSAGGFAYSGADISFSEAPQILLSAYGFTGARVNNYGGDYWQLEATTPARQYINKSTSVAVLDDTVLLSAGTWSGTETDYDGVGVNSIVGDTVSYSHAAIEPPFAMLTDLSFSISDWQDADGACYRADSDLDGDWSDEACAAFVVEDIAGPEVRFARLKLSDAFGPETESLALPWMVEFYDGAQFVTSADDSCSSWLNSEVTFTDLEGSLIASGLTVPSFAYPDTDFRVDLGSAGSLFSAPGAGNNGVVVVNVDLTRQPYFQFDWDGDGLFDDGPAANLFFGKYRSHDKVIFQRQW